MKLISAEENKKYAKREPSSSSQRMKYTECLLQTSQSVKSHVWCNKFVLVFLLKCKVLLLLY